MLQGITPARLKGLMETTKHRQNSRSRGHEMNPVRPEYEVGILKDYATT